MNHKTFKMKKIIIGIAFFATTFFVHAQETNFQPVHQNNLGLISYLVHVKMVSENIVVPQLAALDSLNTADSAKVNSVEKREIVEMRGKIKSLIREYICLKISYDEIILQLMADLKAQNNICLYKKINTQIKSKTDTVFFKEKNKCKSVERYRFAFSEASKAFNTFNTKRVPLHGHGFAFVGFADVSLTDAAGFVWGMVKDTHDMNKDKVDGICEMLDSIRLSDVGDLQSQGSGVKSGGSSLGGDSKGNSKKAKAKN